MKIAKSQVNKIIRKRFKLARVLSIQKINKGYTNHIYEISINYPRKDLILKVGSPKEEYYSIAKEAYIINLIRDKTNIPVPDIYVVDEGHKIIPFDYILMSKLPGMDLDEAWDLIPNDQRNKVAYYAGKMLAELHTIKMDSFGDIIKSGVIKGPKLAFKNEGQRSINSWVEYIYPEFVRVAVRIPLFGGDKKETLKIFDYLLKNQKVAEQDSEIPVLVHTDFHLKHIRVKECDGKWGICGLFDFEYATSAPKTFDWVKLERHVFNEHPEIRKDFVKGYDSIGSRNKFHDRLVRLYLVGRTAQFVSILYRSNKIAEANEYLTKINEWIKG